MKKNKLLIVRSICVIQAAKAHKNTRTEAALVITGLLPVDFRLQDISQRFRSIKQSENDYLNLFESKMEGGQRDEREARETEQPVEIYSLRYQDGEDHAFNTKVYTDGSKCDHGVGAAFVFYIGGNESHQSSIRLAHYCTVFHAELFAINCALKYLLENSASFVECSVISDCKSALEALSYLNTKSDLHIQTWKLAQSVMRKVKLSLHWTKAHVGTVGNERADELARQASGANRAIHFPPFYEFSREMGSMVVHRNVDEKSHYVNLQLENNIGRTAPRRGSKSKRPRDDWRVS